MSPPSRQRGTTKVTYANIIISLDPEQINQLAEAVAARLGQAQGVTTPVTESNPPASNPQTAWSGDTSQNQAVSPADPWGAQPAPSTQSAPAQADPFAPTESQPANVPTCKHGPMRLVPGGVAQTGPRAGQPYAPFYACTQPRNAPDKCQSVRP